MPRAEAGSSKHLSNQMKAKGLNRLRWYCQPCQRSMRDENGFKCHVQSESHVRTLQAIGENPNKVINDYSQQFQRDFLSLLRTSHGEKSVQINHFYQTYIADRHHVHMNATRWASLTEFAKFLGREGICRVSEEEKGLHIAWIDNSPEALRKQDALRKKERQDRGDEFREQKLIQEQVERARSQAKPSDGGNDDESKVLDRKDGEKIALNFGGAKQQQLPKEDKTTMTTTPPEGSKEGTDGDSTPEDLGDTAKTPAPSPPKAAAVFSIPAQNSKPKNVFAAAGKKNTNGPRIPKIPEKKMTEAERIMREELERKRQREGRTSGPMEKRMKISV